MSEHPPRIGLVNLFRDLNGKPLSTKEAKQFALMYFKDTLGDYKVDIPIVADSAMVIEYERFALRDFLRLPKSK